jgi:hypothetical protein
MSWYKDYLNDMEINPDTAIRLMKEPQVGGDHYSTLGIEPRVIIKENNLSFNEGNVLKYLLRHKRKNGKQDLEKAIQYLQFIIEDEYSD